METVSNDKTIDHDTRTQKYNELKLKKQDINTLYYLRPTLSNMESEYEQKYCDGNKDAAQNLYIIGNIMESVFNTNDKNELYNFIYEKYKSEMVDKMEHYNKQCVLKDIINKTQVEYDKLKLLYDDKETDNNSKMMKAYLDQKNNKLTLLKTLLKEEKEQKEQEAAKVLKIKVEKQIEIGILFSLGLLTILVILYPSLSNQIQSFILSWSNDNHS
jgi:hypothetical protein